MSTTEIGRRGGRFPGALALLALGMAWLAMPAAARAQQEAKFIGWTNDGRGVVEDVGLERNVKCEPRAFSVERAAPGKGCTPCSSKKACATAGPAAAANDSPDGAIHVEREKDGKAILTITTKGEAAPRRIALHAGRDAKVTTWFRPDSKALAILVHDGEDRIFVVDLATPSKK